MTSNSSVVSKASDLGPRKLEFESVEKLRCTDVMTMMIFLNVGSSLFQFEREALRRLLEFIDLKQGKKSLEPG